MADKKISALTAAGALDGSELVEVVQSGANVQTTAAAIAVAQDSAIPGNAQSNTQDYTLGERRLLADGRVVMYVVSGSTVNAKEVVQITSGYSVVSSAGYVDGVALYNMSAGKYGWIVLSGTVSVKVDGSGGPDSYMSIVCTGLAEMKAVSGSSTASVPRGIQLSFALGGSADVWLY